MNDEIYHHGIKGRKWGVRHDKERDSSNKPYYYKTENDGYKKLVGPTEQGARLAKPGEKYSQKWKKKYSKTYGLTQEGKSIYGDDDGATTRVIPILNKNKEQIGEQWIEPKLKSRKSHGYDDAYEAIKSGKKIGTISATEIGKMRALDSSGEIKKYKFKKTSLFDGKVSNATLSVTSNGKTVNPSKVGTVLESKSRININATTYKTNGKKKQYKSHSRVHTAPGYFEIYHHGIKGRKWGVRNEDERVTSVERRHYASEERKNDADKLNKEIERNHDKTDRRRNRDTNKTGKKIAKTKAKTIAAVAAIAAATVITGMVIHHKTTSEGISAIKDSVSSLKQTDILLEDSNSLTHWGVKGRRWGVRKQDEKVTSAERMHYAKMQEQAYKDRINANVQRHNSDNQVKSNRHEDDTKLKQTQTRSRYILRGIKIAAVSALTGLRIWQKNSIKKLRVSRQADLKEMKLAKKLGTKTNKEKAAIQEVNKKLAEKGVVPPSSSKTPIVNVVNNNVAGAVSGTVTLDKKLKHSGILGMKWGVRRFQNPDGTLTSAGKARYSKSGEELDARDMSDDELVSATNRLNRERQYNFASGHSSRDPGYKKNIAKKVSATVLGTFAASSLASLVYNKFSGKNALHGKDLAKRTLANGAIAAGLSGIIALGNSMGGIISTNTPIDNAAKNEKQSKKEG